MRGWLSHVYAAYFALQFRIYRQFFGQDAALVLFSRVPRVFLAAVLQRFGARNTQTVNFAGELSVDNALTYPVSRLLENIQIGHNCYIGRQVYFDLPKKIQLADEVVLSSGVKLLTHQDCGARSLSRYYPRRTAPIHLGTGCWIGANAVILCGVRLGAYCVVGAGAVVTQSFPAYSVLVGVPARKVKTLPQFID